MSLVTGSTNANCENSNAPWGSAQSQLKARDAIAAEGFPLASCAVPVRDSRGETSAFLHWGRGRSNHFIDMTEPKAPLKEKRAPLSLRSRIVQATAVLAAPGEDELLLIHEETDDCYALRGSGVDIWAAAAEPTTVAGIRDTLLQIYAVDRDDCERSVLRTVEDLIRHGLFVEP